MKKKKHLMVIILIILILGIGSVFATTDSFGLKIYADKMSVKPGDTIKFTISLTNITLENGIGAIKGKLIYDHAVFEKITLDEEGLNDNITNASGWDGVVYNDGATGTASEGLFITNTSSGRGVKTDSDVFYVTLKVLSSAVEGNTEIKISQIEGSDDTSDIEIADVKTTINIVAEKEPTPTPTPASATATPTPTPAWTIVTPTPTPAWTTVTPTPTPGDTTTTPTPTPGDTTATPTPTPSKTTVTPTPTPTKTNELAKEGKIVLPYTGSNLFILISVIIVVIIGIVALVKYKRMKNI